MLRSKLVVGVVVAGLCALLVAGQSVAWDEPFFIELTGVDGSFSYNDEPDWAWWKADKYDLFRSEDAGGFDLVQARLERRGEGFNVFFAVERLPVLRASGFINDPGLDGAARHELSLDLEVYDLAIGRRFEGPRGAVSPWIGFTHMQLEERRLGLDESGAALDQPVDRASSRLWGAALGVDASFDLNRSWALTGRAVVRWAQGDRSARVQSPAVAALAAEATSVEMSDSTTRAMYGAEVGLRWKTFMNLQLEGGWWYRDWQYDHGPATYSGPFLRLIVGL